MQPPPFPGHVLDDLRLKETVEKDPDKKNEKKGEENGRVDWKRADSPEVMKELENVKYVDPGGNGQRGGVSPFHRLPEREKQVGNPGYPDKQENVRKGCGKTGAGCHVLRPSL
jgi:hypothetical protein